MSFRLFAYYCALCGGGAALFGWALGYFLLAPEPSPGMEVHKVKETALRGMSVGLAIAIGLSLVDSFWIFGLKRPLPILIRVAVALFVGAVGGMIGGALGQFLYSFGNYGVFLVIGWTMTGALVGASIGAYDLLFSLVKSQDVANSMRKLIKCLIGGTVGGILGGGMYLVVIWVFGKLFHDKGQLWSPSADGFVVLGACIGLLVSLAQIILKEAWIKVEAGFRPGREMILAKESTSIGRAESADIALFGDPGVEKLHACIVQKGSNYFLEESDSPPGGTFVNDVKVSGPTPLRSGDLITMGGRSALRFYERPKKK